MIMEKVKNSIVQKNFGDYFTANPITCSVLVVAKQNKIIVFEWALLHG